jgi:hypothetical protein
MTPEQLADRQRDADETSEGMCFHILEVRFPQEQDENAAEITNLPPMVVARGIIKLPAAYTNKREIEEIFYDRAHCKPGDEIIYIAEVKDPQVINTLIIWMTNRTVLDPVGLVSDD